MSLKVIHLVFITASFSLSFGFSWWALDDYFNHGAGLLYLSMGILSALAGIALAFYLPQFLKKMKGAGL